MYKLRNYIFCVLISILLFFVFAASQAAVFTKVSVLNEKTYKDVIENKKIYNDVYSKLETDYQTKENATGIPADVYMNAVDEQTVKEIMNGCVTNAFAYINGKKDSLNYSSDYNKLDPLKNSIDTFFDDYASSIKYTKDDAYYEKTAAVYEEAQKDFFETSDVYQFSTIDKAGYLKYAKKVTKYMNVGIAAIVGSAVVLIILLVVANRKNILNCLYWISISAGFSSVLYLGLCVYLKATNYFDKFAIKAPRIFNAMTGAFNKFADQLIIVNIAVLAVSFIFMLIYIVKGKEKIKA